MVVIIDDSFLFFKKRDIFLSEIPYDIGDEIDIVKFHWCKNRINLPGYNCSETLTTTIDLNQELEEIRKKMSDTLKKKIRRGEKGHMVWKINENFDEFHNLYKNFSRRKGYGSRLGFLGLEFPKVKIMEKYGTLFTIEMNGEILCGHLFLEDDETLLGWFTASKRFEVDKETASLIGNANAFLHWEAIKYAKRKSLKKFNLAGLFSMEEALEPEKKFLNQYKLMFGGQIEMYYSYSKINNKLYKKLSSLYQNMSS
jgi:lipid II:glycine glycyltransferase (peptidoglycan interpeptide bridge formation enzyme)